MADVAEFSVPDPLETLLDIVERRFSVQVDGLRHDALRYQLETYASSVGMSLDEFAQDAQVGMLEHSHWPMVLHLATNHETRFNRNPAALRFIVQHAESLREPRILSVGCSTGEEPYSIAVALLAAGKCSFRIHGTDISTLCIDKANKGIYARHEAIGPMAAAELDSRTMRFHTWVRALVTFEQHNILDQRPIIFRRPDIVLTQNMLIYYRPETRFEILDRLACMLKPGGYLVTAPAETLNWAGKGLTRVSHPSLTVFQRSADV